MYRNFCFTINNPTAEDRKDVASLDVKYLVVGEEVSASGTPHLQGYCELTKRTRVTSLKKRLPRAHLERRKGSAQQAATYCKKDGNFTETGTISRPGKRNDLHNFVAEVKKQKGMKLIDVMENHPMTLARYPRFVDLANHLYRECKSRDTLDNHWYVGVSGSGKSSTARKKYPGLYLKSINKWWDGYDDEDAILLDDFGATHNMLGYYLKIWADHYPFKAEVKGGSMVIRPKTVIVTSQYRIEELFSGNDLEALARRFTVTNFNKL